MTGMPPWCNTGSFILAAINSNLVGYKVHSVGGNTCLYCIPRKPLMTGEVTGPKRESIAWKLKPINVISNHILNIYPYIHR